MDLSTKFQNTFSLQDIAPTKYDHTRKNSLKVNLRGLDEIIGQAIEHLKHRGELVVHTEL